jgi:hypothetical protein
MGRLGVGLVFLVSALAPAGAEIYKWVDDQGHVQYGDAPPPGSPATTIRTPASPPEAEVLRARSRLEEAAEQRRAEDKKEAERRKQEAGQARERAARESRCRYAQQRLHVLELERPVYRLDDDGNRVYLEDDQRARQIAETRARVLEYCR